MSTTNTSGRRKTAVARIYLTDGSGKVTVNGKDYKEYFPTLPLQYIVMQSTEVSESTGTFDVTVNVIGVLHARAVPSVLTARTHTRYVPVGSGSVGVYVVRVMPLARM